MDYRRMQLQLFLVIIICLIIGCNNGAFKKEIRENERNELITTLNKIYVADQKSREKVSAYIAKYGIKSAEVKELGREIAKTDSMNMIVIKNIINKYGWLSKEIVGEQANKTLFLVVQHGSKSDRKYFLPLMRLAVKNNAASAKDLAFLEDRVADEE